MNAPNCGQNYLHHLLLHHLCHLPPLPLYHHHLYHTICTITSTSTPVSTTAISIISTITLWDIPVSPTCSFPASCTRSSLSVCLFGWGFLFLCFEHFITLHHKMLQAHLECFLSQSQNQPWFLYLENCMENQDLGTRQAHCSLGIFLLGHLC